MEEKVTKKGKGKIKKEVGINEHPEIEGEKEGFCKERIKRKVMKKVEDIKIKMEPFTETGLYYEHVEEDLEKNIKDNIEEDSNFVNLSVNLYSDQKEKMEEEPWKPGGASKEVGQIISKGMEICKILTNQQFQDSNILAPNQHISVIEKAAITKIDLPVEQDNCKSNRGVFTPNVLSNTHSAIENNSQSMQLLESCSSSKNTIIDQSHSNKSNYICKDPPKIIWEEHMLINTNIELFICTTCGKSFKEKRILKTHMLCHTNVKPYTCDICKNTFKQTHTLKKHMLCHSDEKPFTCKICEKAFKRRDYLKEHMLCHYNVKPFTCNICAKSFKQDSKLRKHKECHTDEKPFYCEICDKNFKRKYYLQQHMRCHNSKTFTCKICANSFKRKDELRQHLLSHSGEKPFTCDICERGFAQKFNLNKHKLCHCIEKPFICEICERSYKRKNEIKVHMISHTNENPFKCEICNKPFVRKSHLRQHMCHSNQTT